ncbi:branched-chain amino acid transport system ATP-binding protein [Amorphus suaedae]
MPELLRVENLVAGYGAAVVLTGISLSLQEGESLALLGRNGTGKTTLINSLVGVTTFKSGKIVFDGKEIQRTPIERRAELGIGWVPQERNIFRSLTVEENLTATARPGTWTLDRVYDLFPRLAERKSNLGNQLSGGEQQMLAVARALMLNPRLLLLDEPLEGLAPIIVDELMGVFHKVVREEGLSAIIVEQKARKILMETDRAIMLDRGTIVHESTSADLLADEAALSNHLGVTQKKSA